MPDRRLAELFEEEDKPRHMAHRLMEVAQASPGAARAECPKLVEFLRGPMEKHMAYEERAVFPHLEKLGLGEEVLVAKKHHDAVREAADKLATLPADADIARTVFETARLLLHHTNFEADYIYPELSHAQWLELMGETAR